MLEDSATQRRSRQTLGPVSEVKQSERQRGWRIPIGLTASNNPSATSGSERGTLEVHGMRANDVVTYAPSVAISVSR